MGSLTAETIRALRTTYSRYSKTDGAEVVRYVREHADRLSPLSRWEALRRLSAERGSPASG